MSTALLFLFSIACGRGKIDAAQQPRPETAPYLAEAGSPVEPAPGVHVRARGYALMGPRGPAVMRETVVVYCLNYQAWPADIRGRWVRVEGELVELPRFLEGENLEPDGLGITSCAPQVGATDEDLPPGVLDAFASNPGTEFPAGQPALGARVRVRGIALQAQARTGIKSGDWPIIVDCPSMPVWPDAWVGSEVIITGVLDYLPARRARLDSDFGYHPTWSISYFRISECAVRLVHE